MRARRIGRLYELQGSTVTSTATLTSHSSILLGRVNFCDLLTKAFWRSKFKWLLDLFWCSHVWDICGEGGANLIQENSSQGGDLLICDLNLAYGIIIWAFWTSLVMFYILEADMGRDMGVSQGVLWTRAGTRVYCWPCWNLSFCPKLNTGRNTAV